MWLGVRAISKARQPKWRWVDQRRPPHDHVRHQPAGARSDAETVTGKPRGDVEARYLVDGGNDRDCIWHHVDHAGPGFRDSNGAERGEGFGDAGAGPFNEEAVWNGVEHTHLLEGRRRIELPTPGHLPFIDKSSPNAKAQVVPVDTNHW